MTRTAVFDVNETMLDLASLDPVFFDLFGTVAAKREWFARLLHPSVVVTPTGRYEHFGSLGLQALSAVGTARGVPIGADEHDRLREVMASLAAYTEVVPGLKRLRSAGWNLMALTNTHLESAVSGLTVAGINTEFERILSVSTVERFKPDPAPYLHAAEVAGASPDQLWMVAAHDWDLAGAAAVGMHTAFVERPGAVFSASYPPPDISAPDIEAVAHALIAG